MTQKTPIGLKPRYLHDMVRFRDIAAAMKRFSVAQKPIPQEWVEEMLDIYAASLDKLHPIERTAEWIEPTNGADSPNEWRECSHCGDLIDITFPAPLPKHCAECGAKMKNGGERP